MPKRGARTQAELTKQQDPRIRQRIEDIVHRGVSTRRLSDDLQWLNVAKFQTPQHAVDVAANITEGANVYFPRGTHTVNDMITLADNVHIVIDRGAVVKKSDAVWPVRRAGEDGVSSAAYLFYANAVDNWSLINYGTINANQEYIVDVLGVGGASAIGAFGCSRAYVHLGYFRDANLGISANDCERCYFVNGWTDHQEPDAVIAAEGLRNCFILNMMRINGNEVVDLNSRNQHVIVSNIIGVNNSDQVIDINQSSDIIINNVHIYDFQGSNGILVRGLGAGRWSTRDEFAHSNSVSISNVHGYAAAGTNAKFIAVQAGYSGLPRLDYSVEALQIFDIGEAITVTRGGSPAGITGEITRCGVTTKYIFIGNMLPTGGAIRFQVGDIVTGDDSGASITVSAVHDFYTVHNLTLENIKCTGADIAIRANNGPDVGESGIDGLTIRNAEFENIEDHDIEYVGVTGSKRLTIDTTYHADSKIQNRIVVFDCNEVRIVGTNAPQAGTGSIIQLNHVNEFDISGFSIKADGAPFATSSHGILVESGTKGIIHDGIISNFAATGKGAIALNQLIPDQSEDIRITDVQFYGNDYLVWDDGLGMNHIVLENCSGNGNNNAVKTPDQYTSRNLTGIDTPEITLTGATPSVANQTPSFRVNDAGATTVTDWAGGYNGQLIELHFANGNTTLQDTSNGSSIALSGSVNYNPPTGTVMQFRRRAGVWFEVSRVNT